VGGLISPLLANVYLHYVFDFWAERWRRREATGDMIILRYADDTVVGFEHEADARRCGKSRQGNFLLCRKTRQDRMRAKLQEIKEELRRRMYQPISLQGQWLRQVMTGFFNYHAVPTNSAALSAFRYHTTNFWLRTLRRRSQKDRMTWTRMGGLAADWLPKPRILHPWPSRRFAVKHPRWEPCAGITLARICAGGPQ